MIEFQNVSVSFKQNKGTLAAVDDVTFSIGRGEIFGIAGSSGAGKSTLLRTINLLQKPTSGKIVVDSKDVTHHRGSQLRAHRRDIGMIFQHFALAENLTVRQNIAFALKTTMKDKKEIDDRITEYLNLVGILDKADVYPSKLSGGQKQRVAIARALSGGAKILLCDEPTSALDAETTLSILNLIQSLSKTLGITVVIITHELDVIKSICDRCAVMSNGRVVEIGDVYDIFTKPKDDFTKQLISHTQRYEVPKKVIENTEGQLVKLTFRGTHANTPVISEATKRYGVDFNILVGRVEYIGEKPLGVLYVKPVGAKEKVLESLEYLRQVVKEVEVIEDDRI